MVETFQVLYVNDRKRHVFEDIEVVISRDNKLGIGDDGTVDELIVIRVCLNKMETIAWRNSLYIVAFGYGIKHVSRKLWIDVPADNLFVFFKYLCRHTKDKMPSDEGIPNLMILIPCRNNSDETVSVDDVTIHG